MEDEKDASISISSGNHTQFTQTTGRISPSLSNQSVHNNPPKMTICIGKNQQQYTLNDLQLLSYFEALFSSRWKYNDTDDEQQNDSVVIGDNKSLQFGIDELSCIIHIKKHNRIPHSYTHKKLVLLCNATDFFSEDILNEELFIHFFKKCKPSLSFKVLTDLARLNIFNMNNTNNKLISASALKYLQNIRNNISNMKQKWLDKYKSLPISHVSYDNDMIAQMFLRSFSIQWVKMQNETKRKWRIQCGNLKSFFNVWDIIKKRELYKYDRVIFDCIGKMCNDIDISVPIHHSVDELVLVVLKRIFIDTMQIVVSFNNEKEKRSVLRCKSRGMYVMEDHNDLFGLNDYKESLDNDDGNDSGASEYYDYHKFNLQELIRTHLEFIIVNRKQYLEIDELKQMLNIGHYMNGIQKYSFLKTLLSFHNDWIENVQTDIKQNRDEYMLCWKNLIKYLISSEVDYAINCVSQWLSIFIDESKFILNTVGNALSTDGSHKLGFAIANYVTSNAITENKIDPQYMQYLGNSLGLFWKLNNVLGDLDDDHEEDNDGIRVRTININDNHLFNT